MPYQNRKRSYAPSYGRRTRRRLTGYRKKVGYRKYIRKASGRTVARPGRFGFSRRSNRLNTVVAKTIRGMAETKVVAFKQVDYSQPVQTGTGIGISAVKFVGGSLPLAVWPDYLPVGGFETAQGDGKADRDGQFIWLKGSTVNLTIQLDNEVPLGRPNRPITFRVIVFKTKRALTPVGISNNPNSTLFLTNAGDNQGDASVGDPMNAMDLMLQPLNTNSYSIICDRKFNLCHTVENPTGESAIQSNMKSYKNMSFRLQANTKARYAVGTTEPVDFDYRYGFVVYSCYPNQLDPTAPNSWSASFRGTTTFNDV